MPLSTIAVVTQFFHVGKSVAKSVGKNQNERRVLQSYQAWKEAAGLLSLIHLQRQDVAPAGPGSMGGGMDNEGTAAGGWTRKNTGFTLACLCLFCFFRGFLVWSFRVEKSIHAIVCLSVGILLCLRVCVSVKRGCYAPHRGDLFLLLGIPYVRLRKVLVRNVRTS